MHGSTMKDLQEKRGTTPRKREQLLAVLLAGGMGMSVSATGQMRATALAQATRQTTPAPSTFPINPGVKATPDLLQTLGVGSRSIALGGAYSAIADDASATYWNPGRLPAVLNRELMLEYRPVITAFYNSTNSTLNRAGSQPGKPQIGFASLSINPGPLRIGHSVRLDNAFAVSYTVGGYLGLNFNDATVDPAKVGQSNLDLNNPNNGVPIYDPANPTSASGENTDPAHEQSDR